MKKTTGILMVIILLTLNGGNTFAKKSEELPMVSGSNAVAIDTYNNKVLFDKDKDVAVPPASITKVLTAILFDEAIPDDAIITASERAILEEASNQQFLLEEGEEISKQDALRLIMMISSNDVSVAIAEAVSGSVEEFADTMNEKAKELGAKNSNFVNPNGLPNDEHKTSAYDMALIGKEALNYPNVLEAMKKDSFTLETNKRTVEIVRTNRIFTETNNAVGGKTGWTELSKNTLIEMLRIDDKEIVVVTLAAEGADAAYADINNIGDYAFGKIDTTKVFSKGDVVTTIEKGDREIELLAKEDVVITLDGREKVDNKIRINQINEYKSGDVIGILEIIDKDEKVEKTFELYSDENIQIVEESLTETAGIIDKVKENKELPKVMLSVVSIPVIVFLLLIGLNAVVGRVKEKLFG